VINLKNRATISLAGALKVVKIGLSARFLRRAPNEFGIGDKPLQYLEQNMANAIGRAGALVLMIPSLGSTSDLSDGYFKPEAYASELDGLVLQGGVDVCPSNYGEAVQANNVVTDPLRDRYELALIDAFKKQNKPVLGICRGMQLINVFMGGTLHQDIPKHYCPDIREHLEHDLEFSSGGYLAGLYGAKSGKVNSLHHQSVKKLGRDLVIEARSPHDLIIEAIRYTGQSYLLGVQWHPEFHPAEHTSKLGADVLFNDFVSACKYVSSVEKLPLAKAGF
jgi:gamma-glutamyl-gamma-aminobutyrate hydrolase PuuD